MLHLLPDFDRDRLWKHSGSKRANTATRTCENKIGGHASEIVSLGVV